MMNKKRKKFWKGRNFISSTTHGITLIALVVTIVVLLILAGITITMVLGEDGILSQAKLAAEKTKEAEEQQEKDLQDLVGMINDAVNGKDPETLQDAVSSKKVFSNTTKFDAEGNKIDGSSEEEKTTAITIPAGFKITEGDVSKINEGVVISDEAGNEFVWVPCTEEQYKSHTYTGDHSKDNENIITDDEGGWATFTYKAYNDWKDAGENLESVKKYGGFYIARYEAGIPSSMTGIYIDPKSANKTYVVEGRNTSDYAPVSKKGAQAWNFIDQTNAIKVAEKMYNTSGAVISQLVDGIAWDRTVEWIVASKKYADIEKNSTNYGNYATTSERFQKNEGEKYKKLIINSPILFAEHLFEYNTDETTGDWKQDVDWRLGKNYQYGSIDTGYEDPYNSLEDATEKYSGFGGTQNKKYRHFIELSTGGSEDTKLNNIYDLAGNMYEWTTEMGYHGENSGTQYAVLRSGSFNDFGNGATITYRTGGFIVGSTHPGIGFRVVLYVK